MSDYDKLTAAEQDTYDEYCRLRQISDWSGFDDAQQGRKDDAGKRISDRRDELQCLMKSDPKNNAAYNRQARYDFLGTTSSGKPARLCQLPTTGCTAAESSYITEREMWWRIETDYDDQKKRKQACTDWLTNQRQFVWRCAEGKEQPQYAAGWTINNRQQRYYNLQVATKYGSGYDDWAKNYNTTTGAPKSSGGGSSSGKSWRDKSGDWHDAHLGITEDPA